MKHAPLLCNRTYNGSPNDDVKMARNEVHVHIIHTNDVHRRDMKKCLLTCIKVHEIEVIDIMSVRFNAEGSSMK